MKKILLILAMLWGSVLAHAQGQGNVVLQFSGSAFSGSCSAIMLGSDIVGGNLYWCPGPGYTWSKLNISGGGGANPGGSGTQEQYRVDATTFGGIAGTAVGAGGARTWTASGDAITPLTIAAHSGTQSAPLVNINDAGTSTPFAAVNVMGVGAGDIGDATPSLLNLAGETDGQNILTLTNKATPNFYGYVYLSGQTMLVGVTNPPDDDHSPSISLDGPNNAITLSASGNIVVGSGFKTFGTGGFYSTAVHFAALPVSPLTLGQVAVIDDATVSAAGSIVSVGGGSTKALIFYNGTNWVVVASSASGFVNVDLTGQTAAKTATALFTPTSTGLYRATYYAKVTRVSDISSILGGTSGLVLAFTDGGDSVAQTAFTLPEVGQSGNVISIGTGNVGNTTQTTLTGTGTFYAKTGVAITYAFGYSSTQTTTSMAYELHIKLEAM